MRITKNWLRYAKGKLLKRIQQIGAMSDDELRMDFNRVFPAEHKTIEKMKELGSTIRPRDFMWRILLWSVEESIPSAMVD